MANYFSQYLLYSPLRSWVLLIYGVVLGFVLFKPDAAKTAHRLLFAYLLFAFVLYFFHLGVRWYLRFWHLGAALLVNQIFLWTALYFVAAKFKRPRLLAHLFFVGLVTIYGADLKNVFSSPRYRHQREMLAGAAWAAARPYLKIGAINCGILAYYGGGNVVNLDGNMNVGAYDALRRNALYEYCRREGISHLVDFEGWVFRYYGPFWPRPLAPKLEVISYELDDANIDISGFGRYAIIKIK